MMEGALARICEIVHIGTGRKYPTGTCESWHLGPAKKLPA